MSFNIKNGDELITIAGTPKVTRSSLELDNVDNTADLDKPVSTATQAALDLKADITDLDKKANKTFIEGMDNTTSVVTVPENVAGFAAVGKICGKTVKSKNLITFPYAEIGDTYFEEQGVQYTVQADNSIVINGKNESSSNVNTHLMDNYTLHKGITYTLSGIPSYAGLRIRFTENNTGEQILNLTNQGALTVTPDRDIIGYFYISVAVGTTFDNFIVKPMLEYGDVAHEYEPHFEGLRSAPVESVVSRGRNCITDMVNLFPNSSTGASSYDKNSENFSVIAEVEPNTAYKILKDASNRFRVGLYSSKPNVTGIPSNINNSTGVIQPSPIATVTELDVVTGENDKYMLVYILSNVTGIPVKPSEIPNVGVYKLENYKITVSIPQEIRGLPDYGCSAGDMYNYIDFERGVYVHCVTKKNLWELGWGYSSTYKQWSSYMQSDLPAYTDKIHDTVISNAYETYITPGTVDSNYHIRGMSNKMLLIVEDSTLSMTQLQDKFRAANAYVYTEIIPEEIPLSSILYPFSAESGGTITFENEHNLDVQNTVLYKKEVL